MAKPKAAATATADPEKPTHLPKGQKKGAAPAAAKEPGTIGDKIKAKVKEVEEVLVEMEDSSREELFETARKALRSIKNFAAKIPA